MNFLRFQLLISWETSKNIFKGTLKKNFKKVIIEETSLDENNQNLCSDQTPCRK